MLIDELLNIILGIAHLNLLITTPLVVNLTFSCLIIFLIKVKTLLIKDKIENKFIESNFIRNWKKAIFSKYLNSLATML